MTRLTFDRNEAGDILTTKQFIARDKVINGHIIIKEVMCLYFVSDLDSGKVIHHGVCENVSSAKKFIKNKFKELGVIMYDEVRKKLEEE